MDIDLLQHIPLFAHLGREDLQALSSLLTHRAEPPHQTLFWIGDNADYIGIVQSGQVLVVQPDADGKEVTISSIGPGGFFGELSLLVGGPRTATIRTTTDSVLLTLGREDFLNFLEKHPRAAIHMLMELGKRQRDMLQMLRSVKNVNQVADARLDLPQRCAIAIADRMGSWTFVIIQSIIYALWIIVNVVVSQVWQWDPYPFNLLSLVLTAVAGYAAPIIMMSQARQSEKDRVKAELEYQVNVKAHLEVMQLHRKMDRLCGLLEKVKERSAEAKRDDE